MNKPQFAALPAGAQGSWRNSILTRGLKATLTAALAVSMSGALPAAAFATDADILSHWDAAIERSMSPGYQAYTTDGGAEAVALASEDGEATSTSNLPKKYDLRDPDGDPETDDSVVTPVKQQSPWGTCWGFSIIAACETSILSEQGLTYANTGLDLSELQLANALFRSDGAPESIVGRQAGEGYHNESKNPNAGFIAGGFLTYGVSAFASGIGPTFESEATYMNTGILGDTTSDDPIYIVTVTRKKSSAGADAAEKDKLTTSREYLTQAQVDALTEDQSVVSYRERCYAGNYKGSDGQTVYTDWTINSQTGAAADDESWWNSSIYTLENGNKLPEPRILNGKGEWTGVDWQAVQDIKDELYKDPEDETDFSRAVSVAFCADNSIPGDENETPKYISTEWAHYTYKDEEMNHAVTIVGWDDDYDASNFAKGFEDSKEGAAVHTPEGNGAWLVKNSWGSETGNGSDSTNFPNAWGIEDGDGKHTGYFWLSYYDKSIGYAESYDFDLNSYGGAEEFVVDQYDYLPEEDAVIISGDSSADSCSMANIYEAESDMIVRTLGCSTYAVNSEVTYQVYLLDADAETPTEEGHSELALTYNTSYGYAGYHSSTLDEKDWLPLREGQRYAVVVTQRSVSGGIYCVGAATNGAGKHTEAEAATHEQKYRTSYINNARKDYLEALVAGYVKTGLTKEEATKKAEPEVEQMLQSDGFKKELEEAVANEMDVFRNAYFVAVVNDGESFYGEGTGSETLGVASDVKWEDWKDFAADYQGKSGRLVDNVSVKSYAELRDYAEVSELAALEEAIAKGKALLAAAVVSADGTDVAADAKWMTRADHDALAAAIDSAEKVLATAGADWRTRLVDTTASSDEVNAQVAALAGYSSKAGTKQAAGVPGDAAATGGSMRGAARKTPATGDASAAAAAATLGLCGAASVGAFISRRRRGLV